MDDTTFYAKLRDVPDPTPEELAETPLPRCFSLRERCLTLDEDDPVRLYLHEILKERPVWRTTPDEPEEYGGEEGLVRGHLDLPVFIADERAYLPFLDQLEEGNNGLMEAARRYCLQKPDIPFAIWAVWWIRKALEIYRTGICSPPNRDWARLSLSFLRLANRLKRCPDNDEIAADTGMPREKVDELLRIYRGEPLPTYRLSDDESLRRVCIRFNMERRRAFRAGGGYRRRKLIDFVDGDEPRDETENGGQKHDV